MSKALGVSLDVFKASRAVKASQAVEEAVLVSQAFYRMSRTEGVCQADWICWANRVSKALGVSLDVSRVSLAIRQGFFLCKQVFVRDFELDNFLDELDKNFQ